MASEDVNQDIHDVLTAVQQSGETRHQFQTSLLGKKNKLSQDNNDKPISRQHTQPCHMKISPSKIKGAPISKSNLLPFSEHQQQQQTYPKKFISPANKDDSLIHSSMNRNPTRGNIIYGFSQMNAVGGWTSSSSGNRKMKAQVPVQQTNGQKVLEFISPTFTKVRNNGTMFSDMVLPGGSYSGTVNPQLDAQLSTKNGQRINTQETATSSYINKITIHKSNQGYEKFSNTMKFKNLVTSSVDSQSVLLPSHLNRNQLFLPYQPPPSGKSSLLFQSDNLQQPTGSSSFKHTSGQLRLSTEVPKQIANNFMLPTDLKSVQITPEKRGASVKKMEEEQRDDLDMILNNEVKIVESQEEIMGMTFSPSQEIKTKVQDQVLVGAAENQSPDKKNNLNVAKSLPSLSNRGNNNKNGVMLQGMIKRHERMINEVQTSQQKERQQYRQVMGLNETPLFIQSLDQQANNPLPQTMNSIELERFLELITSVNPNKLYSPMIDNPYIAAALAYQKKQTVTNQTTQRYQHIQGGTSSLSQNQKGTGFKVTSAIKLSKSPSPDKANKHDRQSVIPSTNYSSSAAAQGNLAQYQTISNEVILGQKPPGNIFENQSGSVHRTKQKGSKYSNNLNKFAVIAQSIPLHASGPSQVPMLTMIDNDGYPKSSSSASKHFKNNPRENIKSRKKNVAGFRLNVNPSQGLITIASQLNQGVLHNQHERNMNLLDLAIGHGMHMKTSIGEDRKTIVPMQVMKKDLLDRPQSRPQTVHGSTSSSIDLTKEQLFQLRDPSASFADQNMANKELLQQIMKDIIRQRQILHKQHLKKVDHMRRPSSSASGMQPTAMVSQEDKISSLINQSKALAVSELIKFTKDLKDGEETQKVQSISNELGYAENTVDIVNIDHFTRDEYLKIVREWANLRKMTQSFGANSENQQISLKELAAQIFPLEAMGGTGRLGMLFDQFNNSISGQRQGKDFIKKRHLNGRVFKAKQNSKAALVPNKQKEVQPPSQIYLVQMAGELVDPEINLKNIKVYPETSIEIFHKIVDDQSEYKNHPINKAIAALNSFIYVTYRSKSSQSVNIILDHLKPELRKLNLPLPQRGQPITGSYLRSKEFLSQAKYHLMTLLCSKINNSNDFDPKNYEQQTSSHKYFVGRGNNDHIVRVMLKQRFYCNWTLKDKMPGLTGNADPVVHLEETSLDDVNFIWTQVKRQHIVNQFEPHTRLLETASKQNSKQHEGTLKYTQNLNSAEKQRPPILRMYGKIENNYHLSNKKALFANMKLYYEALHQDPFDVLPLTFHIKNGINDPEFKDFKRTFQEFAKNPAFKNVWIVKPGENTNRGYGIQVVSSLTEVQAIVRSCNSSSLGYFSTFIVQKYIERPLLIKRRKFDIRTYGLWTTINGVQKGYYYNDGYIRTSCKEYNTNNLTNKYIHLTNDAIQKKSEDYGKFENGNKLTFKDFQKYLDQNYGQLHIDFYRDMLPQIKKIVQDTYRAVYGKLDPSKRLQGFEIFGYDFMIDEDFRIYLIEVNTNPCLETSCPLLARIISEMLDNSFRVAFDPVFYHTLVSNQTVIAPTGVLSQDNNGPPKTPGEGGARSLSQANTPGGNQAKKQMSINPISDLSVNLIKYELVFDEKIEGSFLREKILTKTMFDPADNVYLQEDDEQADKQEDPCDPADICIAKELEDLKVADPTPSAT